MTRLARLRSWLRPSPLARCKPLNIRRLAETGVLYRYRTRNHAAPVAAFRRAGDAYRRHAHENYTHAAFIRHLDALPALQGAQ